VWRGGRRHAARADHAIDLTAEHFAATARIATTHGDSHFTMRTGIGDGELVDMEAAALDESDEALQRAFGVIDLNEEAAGHSGTP